MGFNTYWKVVNAKNCEIPQNRERVFAISIRKDIDTKKYEFPKDIPLVKKLRNMLDDAVDEKFYLSGNIESKIKQGLINKVCDLVLENKLISAGDVIDPSYANSRLEEIKNNHIKIKNKTNKDISPTLMTTCENLGICVDKPKINVIGNYSPSNHDASRIVDSDGIAPTVKENHGTVTATNLNYKIRKLTPKECWRLMGFKDEQFNLVEEMGVSNSQLYKQAGNSIVVNCIELLIEHLYKAQYNTNYICKDENFIIPHK